MSAEQKDKKTKQITGYLFMIQVHLFIKLAGPKWLTFRKLVKNVNMNVKKKQHIVIIIVMIGTKSKCCVICTRSITLANKNTIRKYIKLHLPEI